MRVLIIILILIKKKFEVTYKTIQNNFLFSYFYDYIYYSHTYGNNNNE